MDLVRYDAKFEMVPFGFINMGVTCYFNSIMQSLLSCPAFVKNIYDHQDDPLYKQNPVSRNMVKLITLALGHINKETRETNSASQEEETHESKNDETQEMDMQQLSVMSPHIWKSMVRYIAKAQNKPIRQVLNGQQCAREGFHLLMDSMDEFNDIQNIFLHRYKKIIYCFDCDQVVSEMDNMYSIFEVHPQLKTQQLEKFQHLEDQKAIDMNKFLAKQTGYVDKDFICPKCKKRGEKYSMDCLVMVPEVLVVLSKKYEVGRKLDVYTEFPEKMVFDGNSGQMHYEAVAQVEHVGGMFGGHYWAICKRKGGWYCLNDQRVGASKFCPTKNTYMVFYHLI